MLLVEPVLSLAVGAVIALQTPSTSPRSMARMTSDDEGNPETSLNFAPSNPFSAQRVRIGAGADAGVADDRLVLEQIIERFHGERLCMKQTLVAVVGVPSHVNLERVETRAGHAADRSERRVARDDAHHAAVLRRHVVDVVGRVEAAAARHILRHHVGLAREMLADVAGDDAAPLVVPPPAPKPMIIVTLRPA